MARFRGTVQGSRGSGASRLGHDGITTEANGWELGVQVKGSKVYGDKDDCFTVYATRGSNAHHERQRIAEVAGVDGQRRITLFGKDGEVVEVFAL